MSIDHPNILLALAIAIGTILVGVWMATGLAFVVAVAALADLALTYVERRRAHSPVTIEAQRKP
jgi:hypothetical protein